MKNEIPECQIQVSFPLGEGFSQHFLTNKELIKELAKRIKEGQISFVCDIYGREEGLECKDYQWMFPPTSDLWKDKKN